MSNTAIIIIVIVGVIIIACGVTCYQGCDKRSMVSTTIEWARLAPFPEEATDFQITTTGSMFSREFRASFTAAPETIKSWLEASPGIQDADIEERGNSIIYKIKPGGGAQHAEVEHDRSADLVRVHTYWS